MRRGRGSDKEGTRWDDKTMSCWERAQRDSSSPGANLRLKSGALGGLLSPRGFLARAECGGGGRGAAGGPVRKVGWVMSNLAESHSQGGYNCRGLRKACGQAGLL